MKNAHNTIKRFLDEIFKKYIGSKNSYWTESFNLCTTIIIAINLKTFSFAQLSSESSIGTFILFDSGKFIGFLSQSSSPPMTLRFDYRNILIMMSFFIIFEKQNYLKF